MSNFKKFLALVLATLMVASMMVITAPAASAYAPTGDYADDIALLSTLGVMIGDGTSYQEKENVTRWQMALLIARIVTGETGNDMWEAEKSEFFTDVTADHYPGAIDFCAEMGYIKGVGDNKFEPEENITYQDGLTMLVRLLGYETENMSYPWGYILKARTLATPNNKILTADINTGNKTPLLREEVANLLAKAIKIELADAKGVPQTGVTLMVTGLKGIDLGKGTLCATWNAGIGNATFAKYGEATFSYKVGTTTKWETVKVDDIHNTGDLALNDLLGFKADLVSVNGVVIATMSNVSIVDSYTVPADAKTTVKIGDVTIPAANITTYGSADNSVFVANTADISTNGRLLVCDINNDGIDKDDVARYIPFNSVKAVYVANNIKVTKYDGGSPVSGNVDVFFTSKNYYKATVATSSSNLETAKLYGIYSSAITGALESSGISKDGTAYNKGVLKEIAKDAAANKFKSTSLYVSVIGDLKSGEVFRGAVHTVGNVTFVSVANYVEIANGTGILNGSNDNTGVYIGETLFTVGYNTTAIALPKVGGIANANAVAGNLEKVKVGTADKYMGWYTQYTDINVIAGNNLTDLFGQKVNYVTVDGKIVALSLYAEAAQKHTSPYNKDSLIINVFEGTSNGEYTTNVAVNDDNTLSVSVYNPTTKAYEKVKIDQINGFKVGQLVNQLGSAVAAKMIIGNDTQVITTAGIVLNLVSNATPNTIDGAKVGLVAVTNVTDGVYSISTANDDLADIKRAVIGSDTNTSGTTDPVVNVTLNFKQYTGNSITTGTYFIGTHKPVTSTEDNWTFAAKYLTVNKDTEFVVIAADGISVTTGVLPTDTDTLVINENNTIVLEISNEKVVLFTTEDVADVISFASAPISTPVNTEGNWYTLTWTSKFVGTEVVVKEDGTNEYHYTFNNLRNLTTGAIETVVIVDTVYHLEPAKEYFGSAWIADANEEAVKGATGDNGKLPADLAASNIYQVFYISAEGECISSSMFSWAIANEYSIGVLKNLANKNQNLLVIDAVELDLGNQAFVVTGTQANAVEAVVSYTITYFNVSSGITTDEIKTLDHTIGSAHVNKILGLGDFDALDYDYCFYKLNEDGTAEVIVNMFDGIRADTTNIADGLVPAASLQ